jgi:kynurenine formamidase
MSGQPQFDPTAMQLIDLSVPLGPSPSESVPVEVEYLPHCCGGAHLAQLVGVHQHMLVDGLGWASERIRAITHNSTHIDAPRHYSPLCAGKPSRTIDEIPLDWFWGEGICFDVSDGGTEPVTATELVAAQRAAGVVLREGVIVLFRTGAEQHYGEPDFIRRGRGLTADAVKALVVAGVRVFGTDAWSIDASYPKMRERATQLGPQAVWEAHFVGREYEFCAIEKLTNLARLPASGFWLAAFPTKVKEGSAGWARPVAFVPTRIPGGSTA